MVLFELEKARRSIQCTQIFSASECSDCSFTAEVFSPSTNLLQLAPSSSFNQFSSNFCRLSYTGLRPCRLLEIHPAVSQVTLRFQFVNWQVHLQVKETLYLLYMQSDIGIVLLPVTLPL